jgi:cytochrome c553
MMDDAMKRLILALTVVLNFAGQASATEWPDRSFGERYASNNCAWCHGPSLQGFTTAPRLAGQRAEYIAVQLSSFKAHSRDNPLSQQYMWGAAGRIGPEVAHALGSYVASLEGVPAADGNRGLSESGRALYMEGNAPANVNACVVCHGPEGQGVGAIPRLAGLSAGYMKQRLEGWSQGFHPRAVPMPGISRNLSPADIDAITSYLSFVK